MQKIEEYISDVEFSNIHKLNEMAQILRDYDQLPQNAEVWVYGEKDIQGIKTPHFHLLIDKGRIELEIKLANVENMEIWRTKGNYPKSWDGITDVRKKVMEWLMQPNKKTPTLLNWQRVVVAWNDANTSHEIEYDFVVRKVNEAVSNDPHEYDEVNEMATINRKDISGVFPKSLAEIELRSRDHGNPPHAHIVWDNKDVLYEIETGKYLSIESGEPTQKEIEDMERRFKEWLPLQSQLRSERKSNQKELYDTWILWYDEEDFSEDFRKQMSNQ